MAALKYWVWLTTLPGLTEYNKLLLMEHFSSPEDIYYADQEALWQVEGLGKEQAALLDNKSMAAADRILADCARKGIFLITMADALYPERLRNIYQPPLLLYGTALRQDTEDVRGVSLERCAIAIGSEGQGLSDAVLAMCRKTLKIPMSERCESLNAAIAAAVLLWESYR